MSEEHQLGDAPIDEEKTDMMNAFAAALDRTSNGNKLDKRKNGFILMVFPFTETGESEERCNYISNAPREDVVALLKHQLARFDGQPDITGSA